MPAAPVPASLPTPTHRARWAGYAGKQHRLWRARAALREELAEFAGTAMIVSGRCAPAAADAPPRHPQCRRRVRADAALQMCTEAAMRARESCVCGHCPREKRQRPLCPSVLS
jgi:hypothetical protein